MGSSPTRSIPSPHIFSTGITGCGVVASSIRVLGTRGGSSILSTPINSLCIVGPARSKTRRCHRRDPSSNLGRCTKLLHPTRAVSLTEKPRASNAAVCGFDSCTASQFTRAAETQRAECESSKLEAAGSSPAGRFFVIPRPANFTRLRSPDGPRAHTRYGRLREFDSRRGLPGTKISRASPRG